MKNLRIENARRTRVAETEPGSGASRAPGKRRILLRAVGLAILFIASTAGVRETLACDNQTERWVGGAFNYWHGTLGKADFCNNTAVGLGAVRQKAADCAWGHTVARFGVPLDVNGDCARQSIESQGKSTLDEFVRIWTIASGIDCSQASIDFFSSYWHGALGKAEYCDNASIGPDRNKAKDCAFQALVRDKGVAPNSCLRDAIANSDRGKEDLDAFVAKWKLWSATDCSQAALDFFSPYWHGALGKEEYCNNASIGPDRDKAKDCAFQALVRDQGVAPNSCLRDAIANSDRGKEDLDAFVAKWQVWSPTDCSRAAIDHFSPYWHGALGKKEYCNNAAIGPDREKAKNCAFQALVRDKNVSTNSCLRDAIADSPEGKRDLDEFVAKWQMWTPTDCSQAAIDHFSPHWHGALGKEEYCNNALIGPDREKAKNCAFQALRDLGVPADSCLRDAIANSRRGKADLDAFVEKWKLWSATDCSQAAIDLFSPHWHGALGKEEYCNNVSIGLDREKAKECAFQALVRDKGVSPNSCLRDAIANSHAGKLDLDEFVRKWQVAIGGDCSQASIDLFSPHWHGALGKSEYCNNASVGLDRQEAQECAFQALVRDKGVAPDSCLRDAIANSPEGKKDLDAFVRRWLALQSAQPAGTVAANMKSLTPTDSESCDASKVLDDNYLPPKSMLDWTPTVPVNFTIRILGHLTLPGDLAFDPRQNFADSFGTNEGRLRVELRAAAQRADPVFSLCQSAKAFARDETMLGEAFADLSVTGKRSFAQFRAIRPGAAHIFTCTGDARAIERALDRAYKVAHAIRFGNSPGRRGLGWIAISGEDDQPHRPVNVPSAEFPQHDLAVTVPVRAYNGVAQDPITVNTRYMIAYPPPVGLAKPPRTSARELPDEPVPVLPDDAEVILFIHGMDSRLEEALDLTHALHKLSAQSGKKYAVISMDLPTSGYADNIDHLRIAPIETLGASKFRPVGAADIELTDPQVFHAGVRNNAPTLDFIEDFIVAFVETLDRVPRVSGVKQKLRAIVGGSLGGNMAMRLGRRVDKDWIRNVVPWSPAAIWPSFAEGWNPLDHVAVAVPWLWAGGDARVVPESDVMRRLFFYYAFDWRMGVVRRKPQAEEWYRDGWNCKAAHMFGARLDRHETYDPKFRLWHWRLGAEQLLFSQQLKAIETKQPLYMQNTTPMLLVCGYDDTGGDLCAHTREVAWKMTNTPGRAFFLRTTGHSIHNERPNWLARNIVDFIERR